MGNHLHLHIKLSNRYTYKPFIRAVTAAIAMAVTGRNRWAPQSGQRGHQENLRRLKFWDYRPFSRIVTTKRGFFNLRNYIRINQLESYGHTRLGAKFIVAVENGKRQIHGYKIGYG